MKTTEKTAPADTPTAIPAFLPPRSAKIQSEHLEKLAIVYVRQSSPQQVLENRESTARQYALAQYAEFLGWPADRVLVIDEDQGQSGKSAENRSGFQRLLSEVTMEHAGIVLGLEMSRLARSSGDWHHLFELCGLVGTLLADQEGVYNANDPNDRLILGLKGIMSEMELQTMRNRLDRGRLNKAQRGEMFHGVPMEQWKVLIKDRLPAYLSWDQYMKNRKRIEENRNGSESSGVPREGAALLSGLLVCGNCDRHMQPSYHGRDVAQYHCNRQYMEATEPRCYGLSSQVIDELLSQQVLRALEPAGMQLSIQAQADVEQERQRLDKLRDFDQLMERVVQLREAGHSASQIAQRLNGEKFYPPKRTGKFTAPLVYHLLKRRGLIGNERSHDELLGTDEWWLTDLARELKMSHFKLRDWANRGWLHSRKTPLQGRWILWADQEEVSRLRQLLAQSRRGVNAYTNDLKTPKER